MNGSKTLLTLIAVLMAIIFGGCTKQDSVNVDCPEGIRIVGVKYDVSPTGDKALSGSDNYVFYEYKKNYGTTYDLQLDLYDNGTPYYSVSTLANGVNADGTCNTGLQVYIIWDGKRKNPSERKYSVPPGVYSLGLRFSYDQSNNKTIEVIHNPWDTDGDDISDAVEDENNKTTGIGQTTILDLDGNSQTGWFKSNDKNFPPLIPLDVASDNPLSVNRGMHDFSLAKGTKLSGSLYNGLRIAHSSTGYYYFPGSDVIDTDNWGVLLTMNNIEWVGRKFIGTHSTSARIGVGDISLSGGGYWPDHPGGTHQQGLIVDLRYMNTDNTEVNFTFTGVTSNDSHFDASKTWDLIQFFIQAGANKIIVDDLTGYQATDIITLEQHGTGPHNTHFHVEFPDPDGVN